MAIRSIVITVFTCSVLHSGMAGGQEVAIGHGVLEATLLVEGAEVLADAALEYGDPQRGAIVFHQPYLACTKCHTAGDQDKPLGPDLAKGNKEATAVFLVESVLEPSKKIKKGFESIVVALQDGKTLTGILVADANKQLRIRDVGQNGKLITVDRDDIEEQLQNRHSIMPKGLVNQLASRQQFLDLIRYLVEISEKGAKRALELRPDPALYAARPLPEYEKEIDHAGMIAELGQEHFERGAAIYNRLCINCHGTHNKPGSLPTSLRFASGKFKNGSDPYTMYQTLTRGFGMMVPQTWMVPEQKYDVIHYIREAYLREDNPSQHFRVDDAYLAGLPPGTTRGPEPANLEPWQQMDYGPNLIATYEIGTDASNFAYKGNAIRLDHGPGGVAQGRYWMIFDYDTMRVAAAWSGEGFIDWHGINFDGRHNIHPRIVGKVHITNPTGPGWAEPVTESFADDQRVVGRDERIYGPLPHHWTQYKGMYHHGGNTIMNYTVGNAEVLEMPGLEIVGTTPVFQRQLNIGPRDQDMILQVAHHEPARGRKPSLLGEAGEIVMFGARPSSNVPPAADNNALTFNGATRVEVSAASDFNLTDKDFTILARIKTTSDGTIFAKTASKPEWVPNGKTLFLRGGRLCYDIGWVGVLESENKVNDGKWHEVAASFDARRGLLSLFVDGHREAQAEIQPRDAVADHIIRIGYTAGNFPNESFFNGEIAEVSFYQRRLTASELGNNPVRKNAKGLVERWNFDTVTGDRVVAAVNKKHHGAIKIGEISGLKDAKAVVVAGISGELKNGEWKASEAGDLRLRIPAGDQPLRFTVWFATVTDGDQASELAAALVLEDSDRDLRDLMNGGPSRWPAEIKSEVQLAANHEPFAVDILKHPNINPWFCRLRLTGFDFYPDGDRVAVCAWDGSVWLVSGLRDLQDQTLAAENEEETTGPSLTWRRIASGLFQPLGLKIVDEKIYVNCRDQICILHDLNGDLEIDYFENFNNDHQVTDHFHEFAMGLQMDDEGNFYYAKSARHALTALVPHHGTLLRVSKDGDRTDILATGFRAANGVCLNPDGSFIVTDQEGHWNPKNRINWVRDGGFYGNMFGYHDVTDSSDEAMEQPLCWITNAFDRSPSELLWVESERWGPLNGSLLNFSYGYGQLYVVPHENIDGQMQGGMCAFPLTRLPTGTMRGRFHPTEGQLYSCGMFAWAGNQSQPGGFYRIRYTGKPVHLPIGLSARQQGMEISFSGELDRESAANQENYTVQTWSLKRTANYGSKHYDERDLGITRVEVSPDGKTVLLELPQIQPTWCMAIRYSLKAANGKTINGEIHNTIHRLVD